MDSDFLMGNDFTVSFDSKKDINLGGDIVIINTRHSNN